VRTHAFGLSLRFEGETPPGAWAEGTGHGPELLVTPKPAVGWNAETWNEQAADDADPILLPWDTKKGGTGYTLHGHEVSRRDLAAKRKH